jgi:diguanylate cyclase (GGDEF)-like protein
MQATSLTSRLRRSISVRDMAWWQLPPLLRCYVAVVPLAAVTVIGIAAAHTQWHWTDLLKFLLLTCCGMVSVAATPRIMYSTGGVTRDFTTVWVLPAAILLPPLYAALIPIALYTALHVFVHRGVPHRTVFSVASISLPYAACSLTFRSLPASIAGPAPGSGLHALTWVVIVACCEVVFGRAHHFMILFAAKLSDRRVRIAEIEWNREAMQGLFAEIDLSVLITLAGSISTVLVVLALPTVLLVRRFIIHPILMAQSRIDSKTGLLNVSTWERDAEAELSRSVRTRSALALAILDIDHFKRVNDTYGHLVGDRVLRAVADTIKGQSRDYDKAGRFGGEEFVLLLAHADEDDACRIAERLRARINDLVVPIDDRDEAPVVQVTISIGVSALPQGTSRGLADMLTAADSALYRAKQAGRNRVCVSAPVQSGQLVAELASRMDLVRQDPAGASLCPERSL